MGEVLGSRGPRHDHGDEVRAVTLEECGQFRALHPSEHDVGHEEIDVLGTRGHVESVFRTDRLVDDEAVAHEHLTRETT